MTLFNTKKLRQTCAILILMGAVLVLDITLQVVGKDEIMRLANIILSGISACTATTLYFKSRIVNCDSIEDVMDTAEENFCDRNNSILLALASLGFLIWAL